jgi:ribonuclease D
VIDTREKLATFLPRLQAAEWIALDTEADSLHAYPEKLCLLQISIAGHDVLVDPLARFDLAPLWEILRGRELIMHGADYDLRLLRKSAGFIPQQIFDTMIAARLVGQSRFSLSDLVSHYLGVALEKGPQKANWARRPLTRSMELYARNDTHYLKRLADLLRTDLREKGRLAWHEETCARLVEECSLLRPPDPDLVWRIKGSARLNRHALAVLRELWHWREQEATARNRPPYFILSPERMIALASGVSQAQSAAGEPHVPRHFSEAQARALDDAIRRAHLLPADELPAVLQPSGTRITYEQKRRLHVLQHQRDRAAERLGIDATLIASRSTLVALTADWDAHQHRLMSWQRDLLKPEPKPHSLTSSAPPARSK